MADTAVPAMATATAKLQWPIDASKYGPEEFEALLWGPSFGPFAPGPPAPLSVSEALSQGVARGSVGLGALLGRFTADDTLGPPPSGSSWKAVSAEAPIATTLTATLPARRYHGGFDDEKDLAPPDSKRRKLRESMESNNLSGSASVELFLDDDAVPEGPGAAGFSLPGGQSVPWPSLDKFRSAVVERYLQLNDDVVGQHVNWLLVALRADLGLPTPPGLPTPHLAKLDDLARLVDVLVILLVDGYIPKLAAKHNASVAALAPGPSPGAVGTPSPFPNGIATPGNSTSMDVDPSIGATANGHPVGSSPTAAPGPKVSPLPAHSPGAVPSPLPPSPTATSTQATALLQTFTSVVQLAGLVFAQPTTLVRLAIDASNNPEWWQKAKRRLEGAYGRLYGSVGPRSPASTPSAVSTPTGGPLPSNGPLALPLKAHKELKVLWEALRGMESLDYLSFHALPLAHRLAHYLAHISAEFVKNPSSGRYLPVSVLMETSQSPTAEIYEPKWALYAVHFHRHLSLVHPEISTPGHWADLELVLTDFVAGVKHTRLEDLAAVLDGIRRVKRADWAVFYAALFNAGFKIEYNAMELTKRCADKFARAPTSDSTCHVRWLKARSLLLGRLPKIIWFLDNILRESERGQRFGKGKGGLTEVEEGLWTFLALHSDPATPLPSPPNSVLPNALLSPIPSVFGTPRSPQVTTPTGAGATPTALPTPAASPLPGPLSQVNAIWVRKVLRPEHPQEEELEDSLELLSEFVSALKEKHLINYERLGEYAAVYWPGQSPAGGQWLTAALLTPPDSYKLNAVVACILQGAISTANALSQPQTGRGLAERVASALAASQTLPSPEETPGLKLSTAAAPTLSSNTTVSSMSSMVLTAVTEASLTSKQDIDTLQRILLEVETEVDTALSHSTGQASGGVSREALRLLSLALFSQFSHHDHLVSAVLKILAPTSGASPAVVEALAQWLCSGPVLHIFLLHGYMAELLESLIFRAWRCSAEASPAAHGLFAPLFLALFYALDLCQLRTDGQNRRMLLLVLQKVEMFILSSTPNEVQLNTGDYTLFTWISEYLTDFSDHSRKFASGEKVVHSFVSSAPSDPHQDFYGVCGAIELLGEVGWVVDRVFQMLSDGLISESQVTENALSNIQLWCPYLAPALFLLLANDATRGPVFVPSSGTSTVDYARAKNVIQGVTREGLKKVMRLYGDYGAKLANYDDPDFHELREFLSASAQANGLTPPEDPLAIDSAQIRPAVVAAGFFSWLSSGGQVDLLALSHIADLSRTIPPLALARLIAREVSKECRDNPNPAAAYSRAIRAAEYGAHLVGRSGGEVAGAVVEGILHAFLPDIRSVLEAQVWAYFLLLSIVHSHILSAASSPVVSQLDQGLLQIFDRFLRMLLTLANRQASGPSGVGADQSPGGLALGLIPLLPRPAPQPIAPRLSLGHSNSGIPHLNASGGASGLGNSGGVPPPLPTAPTFASIQYGAAQPSSGVTTPMVPVAGPGQAGAVQIGPTGAVRVTIASTPPFLNPAKPPIVPITPPFTQGFRPPSQTPPTEGPESEPRSRFQAQPLMALLLTFVQLGAGLPGLFDAPATIRPATRDSILHACLEAGALGVAAKLFRLSPSSALGARHQTEALTFFASAVATPEHPNATMDEFRIDLT